MTTVARRELLLTGAAFSLATMACRSVGPAAAAPQPKSPAVSIRDRDHLHALERAIAATRALESIRNGDKVLLKVNTNSGDPYPYSTSPKVVRWLGERLRDLGAQVFVGDRSFWGDTDTAGNLEANGIAAAARAAGAKVTVFDDEVPWREVPPELVPSWRPPVRVPRIAVEADALINLACLKTHFITGTTLALKNFLGLVHADDRRRPGNLRTHHPDRIHRQIVELHRFVRAELHIIDGHSALCSGGPTPGSGDAPTIKALETVIAARHPVAADVIGVSLLARHASENEAVHGIDAYASPTIAAALEQGLRPT
jgi:uncharacterized protein (DUF362 family)